LHGGFETPPACRALLQWAGLGSATTVDTSLLREQSLDRIADAARPLLDALKKLTPFTFFR
jgi:adenosylcobyric acid synthase